MQYLQEFCIDVIRGETLENNYLSCSLIRFINLVESNKHTQCRLTQCTYYELPITVVAGVNESLGTEQIIT